MKAHEKYSGKRSWKINNDVPGFDLSTLPRCTATAKSTGKQCRRAAKKGHNFCGQHSGTSHPGVKKGTRMRSKHGYYAADAEQDRREARAAMQSLNGLVGALRQRVQGESL